MFSRISTIVRDFPQKKAILNLTKEYCGFYQVKGSPLGVAWAKGL